MRIDTHNHALPETALDFIRRHGGEKLSVTGDLLKSTHFQVHFDAYYTDPAAKLEALQKVGLEAAVLSSVPMTFGYDLDPESGEALSRAVNDGLKRMCEFQPGRLRWMATVPMQDPARAAACLAGAAGDGCVGVEIATSLVGRYFDDEFFEPFWAEAEAIGLPVMIHPAYGSEAGGFNRYYLRNVIGNLLETTIAVERLIAAGVLDRHPSLKLLLVHAGGYFPFQAGRLRHAAKVRLELAESPPDPYAYRGQVVVDTITHDPQTLRFVIDRMGEANVVMGTDFPFDMAPEEPMQELIEAVGEATARVVAEVNPAKMFGFPTAQDS